MEKIPNDLTGDLYTNEQKRDMFDYLDYIEMAEEDNDMDSDVLIDIYKRKFLAIYYSHHTRHIMCTNPSHQRLNKVFAGKAIHR